MNHRQRQPQDRQSQLEQRQHPPQRGQRPPQQGQRPPQQGQRPPQQGQRPPQPPGFWRPNPQEIAAARGKRIRDVIAPGLKVLFCGINPGLYSGATGHHFARPGNRFWKALHAAGFTDRVLSPFEERELLDRWLGITNLVGRSTAVASELHIDELRRGAAVLERKVARMRPAFVAFLGLDAYRVAFGRSNVAPGLQEPAMGKSRIWLLPNPSGLNAHYQLPELVLAFAALRKAARVGISARSRRSPHPLRSQPGSRDG